MPHSGLLAPTPHLLSRSAGPTTLTYDLQYQNVINQYFTDVAHDSGSPNNVYSAGTQYFDDPGAAHIQYSSTFGGSYVDKDPLPANGCADGVDPFCLTDKQLQNEIQTVLTANGWHGGLDHIFFLLTPNGVGSCFGIGECSTNTFCAYHNAFADSNVEHVIYANEPYEGPDPAGGCVDPSQGFPNDVDADTTVNTISHEHNEAITDPLSDPNHQAWIAGDGSENGDLCAFSYGAQTGTPGVDAYNQVINGHHYELQQEWSNADSGCVQRLGGPSSAATFGSPPLVYQGGPVMHTNTTYAIYWLPTARNTSRPVVTGAPVVNTTLTTSVGEWSAGGAAPFAYQWQRCSSTGKGCVDIPGATAATYRLTSAEGGRVVRSTISATNVNGLSLPAPSAGTAVVVGEPAVTKAPRISGRARVGRKLSGRHGSWTYPAHFGYQWLRCDAHGGDCSNIRSATHSTYRLTTHEAGHRLRLRISATNAAGSMVAVSAATAPVAR